MSVKQPTAMAKAKEPKKVSKTKDKSATKKDATTKKSKSKSAPVKTSNLSEEKVVDSDSEEEVQVKAPPALPKGKESESSDSSDATSSDSEDEQEKTASAPKKPEITPAKVNGMKRKSPEQESSSSEEEDDTSSDDEVEEPQAKKAKTNITTKETPARGKAPAVEESAIQSIPAPKYQPPTGYTAVDSDSLEPSSALAQSSLDGKQIWHIIAPSKVPLGSVTEFALSSLKDQTPVLTHKGVEYVLARGPADGTAQYDSIMLPHADGYTFSARKIEETLHLQQKIMLPNLGAKQAGPLTGSNAAGNIAQAPVSTARPQPKGMKMRYKPPGFGQGNPGLGSDSDEEASDRGGRTGGVQFPKTQGAHGASDKPDSARTPKTKQKHKKRKDPYDVDVEMDDVDTDPMMPSPSAQPPKKKKENKQGQDGETLQRAETATSQQSGASAGSNEKEKPETPEERAKRKEVKRLKKEAKKKARE